MKKKDSCFCKVIRISEMITLLIKALAKANHIGAPVGLTSIVIHPLYLEFFKKSLLSGIQESTDSSPLYQKDIRAMCPKREA